MKSLWKPANWLVSRREQHSTAESSLVWKMEIMHETTARLRWSLPNKECTATQPFFVLNIGPCPLHHEEEVLVPCSNRPAASTHAGFGRAAGEWMCAHSVNTQHTTNGTWHTTGVISLTVLEDFILKNNRPLWHWRCHYTFLGRRDTHLSLPPREGIRGKSCLGFAEGGRTKVWANFCHRICQQSVAETAAISVTCPPPRWPLQSMLLKRTRNGLVYNLIWNLKRPSGAGTWTRGIPSRKPGFEFRNEALENFGKFP